MYMVYKKIIRINENRILNEKKSFNWQQVRKKYSSSFYIQAKKLFNVV